VNLYCSRQLLASIRVLLSQASRAWELLATFPVPGSIPEAWRLPDISAL
jgi:hypothetical protein